jgi:multisubunit Na+/H+ antiporter MnhF subunit
MDMFVDIAIAYAMLNFSGSLVVAKYLNASRKGTAG